MLNSIDLGGNIGPRYSKTDGDHRLRRCRRRDRQIDESRVAEVAMVGIIVMHRQVNE